MCHLLQCKLLWDPHGWLFSTSKANRDRAGPGRWRDREWDQQGDRERDRDPTEIWKLFQCLFSASGIFFGNFIELFSELKHPIFLLWRCGFLLPPSFYMRPTVPGAAGTPCSQWISVVGGADTPVQHPERAAIFSKYHISAALAGVEESPLAVTVIPLLGELM